MSPDFHSIVSAPPSGRGTALVVDHGDFGSAVILQGKRIPWLEVSEVVGYFGRVQGLLDPDATFVDAGLVYEALLERRADLVAEMGVRTRTGFALKTLLADETSTGHLALLIRTLADSTRRPVVLQVPSPLRWLAWAHARAGTAPDSIESDHADNASVYIADWLRNLAGLPLCLLLMDGRGASDPDLEDVSTEDLTVYTAIVNAVEHYRWNLGLRSDERVGLLGETPEVLVPETFWTEGRAPESRYRFAHIPADARPEVVLTQLALLR